MTNQQRYKRPFGPQEANNAPAALGLPRCQQCGKHGGLASRPIFLEYTSAGARHLVAHKNQCVFCGAIQYWNARNKAGELIPIPAIYVLHSQSRKPLTAYREFSLPEELYKSGDKADVGLKVDIIRALVRLQLERPTEYIFTLKEALEGLRK